MLTSTGKLPRTTVITFNFPVIPQIRSGYHVILVIIVLLGFLSAAGCSAPAPSDMPAPTISGTSGPTVVPTTTATVSPSLPTPVAPSPTGQPAVFQTRPAFQEPVIPISIPQTAYPEPSIPSMNLLPLADVFG